MKKDLSVIIPHFNSPGPLDKLLASIPDRDNIQIVVVDDNSTVGLKELEAVKEKYSSRVEFYKNETGIQSAGACRNTGIEYATGTWVLFADADDYFLPDMYAIVEQYFQSDYDMVIFCPTSSDIDTGEMSNRHRKHEIRINTYLKNPSRQNYLSLCRTTTIWSKLIRRQVIEDNEIRCNTSLHGNDFVCSQKLFYYCKNKKVTNDVIYCVTMSSTSLTTKKSSLSFHNSVQERTNGYLFNKNHYSKEDLRYIDLSGGEALVNGIKKHLGPGEILWGTKYFIRHGVNIVPFRLRNLEGIKTFMKNKRLI